MLVYIRHSQAPGQQAIHLVLVYLPTPYSLIITFNFTLPVPPQPFQWLLVNTIQSAILYTYHNSPIQITCPTHCNLQLTNPVFINHSITKNDPGVTGKKLMYIFINSKQEWPLHVCWKTLKKS